VPSSPKPRTGHERRERTRTTAIFADEGRIVLDGKPTPETGLQGALVWITPMICGTDIHILKEA
jgi:alcohol dehydrogenase